MEPLPQSEHIEIQWYDGDQALLYVALCDGVTWSEIETIADALLLLHQQHGRPVYNLVHMLWEKQVVPLGGNDYPQIDQLMKRIHPLVQMTVMIVENGLATRIIARTACRAYYLTHRADHFRVASSLVEALAIVLTHQMRSTAHT